MRGRTSVCIKGACMTQQGVSERRANSGPSVLGTAAGMTTPPSRCCAPLHPHRLLQASADEEGALHIRQHAADRPEDQCGEAAHAVRTLHCSAG